MLAMAHVTVTSSSDVEITLHLVQVQTSVDTAAVGVAPESGCLRPLSPLLSKRNNIVNVLLSETLFLIIILGLVVSLTSYNSALSVPPKLVNALVVGPLSPKSLVETQLLGRHDSVTRSILDVNMEIIAVHLNHDIQVDLHFP